MTDSCNNDDGVIVDPRIVYWAKRGGMTPQTYMMEAVFPTGTVGEMVQPQLKTPMAQDFWVHRVSSLVEMPAFGVGNIQEAQYEYFRGFTSNIDVQMQVLGGGIANQYMINDSLTPLSLVAPPSSQGGGGKKYYNWVLQASQTIRTEMVLRRSYVGQIPRVVVMLEGFMLNCQNLGHLSPARAEQLLRDLTANPGRQLGSLPDEPRGIL